MNQPTTPERAWLLWDSGMGIDYTAVRLLTVGPKRKFATVERGQRRFRVKVGDLSLVPDTSDAPEWAEDYRRNDEQSPNQPTK